MSETHWRFSVSWQRQAKDGRWLDVGVVHTFDDEHDCRVKYGWYARHVDEWCPAGCRAPEVSDVHRFGPKTAWEDEAA